LFWLAVASLAMVAAGSHFADVRVAAAPQTKRVLVLTHNTFYNHGYLAALEGALPEWGKTAGFTVTSLDGYKQTASCVPQKPCEPSVVDLSRVTRKYLSQFDGIVASTNGELPFSDEAKQALVDFVQRDGKGIVFVHQSVVTMYAWKPWGEMLGAYLGAFLIFDPQNAAKRPVVIKVEDRDHPATRNLPEHWTLDDEFYDFAKQVGTPGPLKVPVPMAFSRDKVHVLASFDTARTDFAGAPKGWDKTGDYPQVWYQHIGRGRTFYSAIGHRDELWTNDPVYRRFMVGAIRWALGLEK
jgi:hypothetical protein